MDMWANKNDLHEKIRAQAPGGDSEWSSYSDSTIVTGASCQILFMMHNTDLLHLSVVSAQTADQIVSWNGLISFQDGFV